MAPGTLTSSKRKMAQKMKWIKTAALLLAGAAAAGAQSSPCIAKDKVPSPSRIAGDWRVSETVRLETAPASRNRLSVRQNAGQDIGIAPGSAQLERMLLLLEPSSDQRAALDTELVAQQTPGSCEFHKWLTAAEFAERYAVSAEDAQSVATWLKSGGFDVAPLPLGRGWIEFSGTAAKVEQAFHAEVHIYGGEAGKRYALSGAISVPQALAPVIHGLVSLDGARAEAAVTKLEPVKIAVASLAQADSAQGAEAMTPRMMAKMLHLPETGGAGETIAIAARSGVSAGDVASFRAAFGLPASALAVVSAGGDAEPNEDRAEAEFAAEWAGVAAPGAKIAVVSAPSTKATDGIDLSLTAIADGALAHTAVVGFSACEAGMSEAHRAFYVALYRQAAAEGIAIVAAAGDSGAAACHAAGSDAAVTSGLAVNALASTPWNTAVGASAPGGDSTTVAWSPATSADAGYAGGGGASSLYGKPEWQSALMATDAGRLLPDLALPAGVNSAASRGMAFCYGDAGSGDGCTLVRGGGSGAAAAIFGGISAQLAEKYGAQGNLVPRLYTLSGQKDIFDDVTEGDARLQCEAGSPGCDATGRIGFAAGVGYDLATGLGSVNAVGLIKAWPQATGTAVVVITLTASPTTLTLGIPEAFTAVLAPASGSTGNDNITGTVSFYDGGTTLLGSATVNSYSATLSSITLDTSKAHLITAVYSGDTTWAAVISAPLSLASALLADTVTLTAVPTAAGPGQAVALTVTVTPTKTPAAADEQNPTGIVTFYNATTAIGTATLTASLGNSSTATLTTATLPAGVNTITAVYAGDSYFAIGTSNAVTVTVQDFTIAGASGNPPSGLTIVKGGSGSAAFVVTGLGGYNNQIQVTCNVPAQDYMTCTPSPVQVTPTGTVTFTVQTFKTGEAATSALHRENLWVRAAGGLALAFVVLMAPVGRRARRWMALVVLFAGIGGAGLGCGSSGSNVTANSGTPLGTTTLTITATAYVNQAVVSHSAYLTVNVVPGQ